MICTVTFNPSLDYIVSVDDFQLGMTNRTSSELILPGGKGINVSIVLKNLGLDSTALGYVAGFTGEELIRRLTEFGVNADFIKINHGMTRINVKPRGSHSSVRVAPCRMMSTPPDRTAVWMEVIQLSQGQVSTTTSTLGYFSFHAAISSL